MRIFLSYASEHRAVAEKIWLKLVGANHEVFFDRSSLEVGKSFDLEIRNQLTASDLLIFLLSPESVESGSYALTEVEIARQLWTHPEGHVLVVQIAEVDASEVPAYLQATTYLTPQGDPAAEVLFGVERIAAAAGEPTSAAPSRAIEEHPPSRRTPLLYGAIIGVAVLAGLLIWRLDRSDSPLPADSKDPLGNPPQSVSTPARPAESGSTEPVTELMRTNWLGVEVFQQDRLRPMLAVDLNTTRVLLQRLPFTLKVPGVPKDGAIQICAWSDSSIFEQLRANRGTEERYFFSPGTGMADTEFGSSILWLEKNAHNYFYGNRIKVTADGASTLYFSRISSEEEDRRAVKDQMDDLYLVVFVDKDGNGEVNDGEFEFLILDFGSKDGRATP